MTRLLLLSVQRILKNLNKIRRKILHAGERPLDAVNDVSQSMALLRSSRRHRRCEQCEPKCEGIEHIFESTPCELYRSMRRAREQHCQSVLHPRIIGANLGSPAVNIDSGGPLSERFESDAPRIEQVGVGKR